MKKSVSFLIAMAIMAFSSLSVSANTTENTPISGSYEGSLQTKTFIENNTNKKLSIKTDSNVELLFNGNVFIYQGSNSKCMGNYTIKGDVITFTVTSSKGNSERMKSVLEYPFKYSKSGNRLMLISSGNPNGDVFICNLNKTKS